MRRSGQRDSAHDDQADYRTLSRRARRVMWLGYAALLIALTLSTVVVPSCNRSSNPVVWVLLCLPLLAFLPVLLKGNVRACAWFCFVLLFYFLAAVPVAFACTGLVTVLEVVTVSVLFVATMLYIRWQSRYLRQSNPTPTQESSSDGR